MCYCEGSSVLSKEGVGHTPDQVPAAALGFEGISWMASVYLPPYGDALRGQLPRRYSCATIAQSAFGMLRVPMAPDLRRSSAAYGGKRRIAGGDPSGRAHTDHGQTYVRAC